MRLIFILLLFCSLSTLAATDSCKVNLDSCQTNLNDCHTKLTESKDSEYRYMVIAENGSQFTRGQAAQIMELHADKKRGKFITILVGVGAFIFGLVVG